MQYLSAFISILVSFIFIFGLLISDLGFHIMLIYPIILLILFFQRIVFKLQFSSRTWVIIFALFFMPITYPIIDSEVIGNWVGSQFSGRISISMIFWKATVQFAQLLILGISTKITYQLFKK